MRIARRAFLRLAALAGVGALAACDIVPSQTEGSPPEVARTVAPVTRGGQAAMATQSTPLAARIALDGGDAEIWAWQAQVQGSATGCTAIEVRSGDTRVAAEQDGDRFNARVPLTEGQNQIVAVCRPPDGSEVRSNALNYRVRLRNRPTANITASIEGTRIVLDGSASQPAEVSSAPIVDYTWAAREDNPAPIAAPGDQPLAGPRIALTLPDVDGEYYVSLRVVDAMGRDDTSTTYVVVEGGVPRLVDHDRENPAWVESAIVYGVIVRNFGSDGFRSVTEKLDYLHDLGINALWLSPVNVSPPGDFGYAVVDYFELNPNYGTKDDFRSLVQAAHRRGIRILMDFVPNHTSIQHPYFQDTLVHKAASPYWEFYDRDKHGSPTHYFDWTHLPNLNYDHPQVERWMIEAFAYWVREFDVDGFRVDVAWGIKERKPDFWPRWRRELKRIKPDLLLLAEASARDGYYFTNGFDAAYDWTAQLGHWAWERVFESEELMLYNLHAALTNGQRGFHPDALIFRFLNNNDTGTRFITTHGLELTKVFAALLLTLHGIPCVYTGDEVGEWFRPYNDPAPITWKDRYGLRPYYKKLIALRKALPSLHSRHWQPLEVEPHQQVYGYVRFVAPALDPVLVLLNVSDQALEAEVPLPPEFQVLADGPTLQDLLMDEPVPVSGPAPLRVPMPPWSARILVEHSAFFKMLLPDEDYL